MLQLHHAARFDTLLDALARVLAPAPADPFTPDVVVVPSAGSLDAAMAGLGVRHGVVANTEFIFPGAFVARSLGGAADADPWRIDRLTWYVLEELVSGTTEGLPMTADHDAWALARRIADLFDRYGTQRPPLLRSWAAGPDARGVYLDGTHTLRGGVPIPGELDPAMVWQAELWRRVRARIGVPSPAERLPGMLDALRSGEIAPLLPERVCVFGLASLSPSMLSVLSALATQRTVHVFVQTPSPVAWSASPHAFGAGQVRTDVDVTASVAHPLLASWGRPALETRGLVRGLAGIDEVVEPIEPTGDGIADVDTVLGALQHDIRMDVEPHRRSELVPTDGSFQVHACHGETRQIEVLRDALGHLFAADPTLMARDVVVLCPDLERFAPLIGTVFSRGNLPIPVRVGDRSLTTEEPLAAALMTALSLASGRATLSEVLAFVQMPPVRRSREWSTEDVERLGRWCTQLGARWGLEADNRTEWGLPSAIQTGTWRQAVDRLLAGIAMPAPTPRAVPGEVAPYDHIAAGDIPLVGGIAEVIARLVTLHERISAAQPVDRWVSLLHDVVDDFCEPEPDEPWRLAALHADLDDIAAAAVRPDGTQCTVPISLDDLLMLLNETLGERAGRPRLRTGAVTVTSLIPQRGVPARVVCILGLDDGAVRSGVFDGDDVLGAHPCAGERHPRYESRHLLLDAVLAAQERLIITCNGADLTTNKPVPFIVALSELLDVVRNTVSLHQADAPVVVRHPRHGFDERALIPGGLSPDGVPPLVPAPFTFDPAMLAAAEAHRRASAGGSKGDEPDAAPWRVADPSPTALASVELSSLAEAIVNPARVFLRDRLGVGLPGEEGVIEDGLALGVESLQQWKLGTALLDALRAGGSADAWRAATALDGTLPPAAIGGAVLDLIVEEVDRMASTAAQWGVPLAGAESVKLTSGAVVGEIGGLSGTRLVSVRYTRVRESQYLSSALRLALLQIEQPDTDWTAVMIFRPDDRKKDARAVGLRFVGSGEERRRGAVEFVTFALTFYAWLQREAVPFFEYASAPLADRKWALANAALTRDQNNAHSSMLWPDVTLDWLRSEPLLDDDPAEVHEAAKQMGTSSRAEAVAAWVWGTFHRLLQQVDHAGAVVKPAAAPGEVTAEEES
jgi:exodeoxyribonuclease V gamma subunit